MPRGSGCYAVWRPAGARAATYSSTPGSTRSRPLEAQGLDELIWIREPFLTGRGWRHSFAVVHGHTPFGPEVLPHRVGTDSGCCHTGVLTAVELADDRLRFHGVAGTPDLRDFQDALDPDQRRLFGTASPSDG